jgi:hypothetical protein
MNTKKKKSKYPTLNPQFSKDSKGNLKTVYLKYDEFESIFQRINDLERILNLKKKK